MSKKLKTYRIMYRQDSSSMDVEIVYTVGRSKAEVLMDLINSTIVFSIKSIERLDDE